VNSQPTRPNILNSQIVRAKIELFGRNLGDAAHRFWTRADFARLYRDYIFISHAIIRASAPLMEHAERACGYPEHAGDAVLEAFARYLRRHIREETGHDRWILDDGEALGIERSAVLGHIPHEAATRLVGIQYYWIHHYNPIALAGYIAVMEGNPPTTEFIEDTARRNNLSLKCFSAFLYHAKLDPGHRCDLDNLLDNLQLTADHLSLIGLSSLHTLRTMTEIMQGLAGPPVTEPPLEGPW
jgi:hypothetical protein